MSRLLSIDADVTLHREGTRDTVRIQGHGRELAVELPSLAAGLRLVSRAGWRSRSTWKTVTAILRCADLRVTVRTPRRRLLSVGALPGSWWLAAIGLPNVKVHAFP